MARMYAIDMACILEMRGNSSSILPLHRRSIDTIPRPARAGPNRQCPYARRHGQYHQPRVERSFQVATSIIGTWNVLVDWGCDGNPVQASPFTFSSDGSWTYQFGGGRWIQVEGLAAWNFNNAPGLIYTANVTRNALVGIMGYAVSGSSPGTGCFYMLRQQGSARATAPSAQASAATPQQGGAQAAAPSAQDVAVAPPQGGTPAASTEDIAVGPPQ